MDEPGDRDVWWDEEGLPDGEARSFFVETKRWTHIMALSKEDWMSKLGDMRGAALYALLHTPALVTLAPVRDESSSPWHYSSESGMDPALMETHLGLGPSPPPMATPGHSPSQLSPLDVLLRAGAEVVDAGDTDTTAQSVAELSISPDEEESEAMRWYRRAADQGDAHAQFIIGCRYYNGDGVVQDFEEAMRWYRRAADQGRATAQFMIGFLYHNGRGAAQDYEEAMKWYRCAADQGHADAQYYIGDLYSNGDGVAKDYGEAMRWYRRAAEQGHADAKTALAA